MTIFPHVSANLDEIISQLNIIQNKLAMIWGKDFWVLTQKNKTDKFYLYFNKEIIDSFPKNRALKGNNFSIELRSRPVIIDYRKWYLCYFDYISQNNNSLIIGNSSEWVQNLIFDNELTNWDCQLVNNKNHLLLYQTARKIKIYKDFIKYI